MIPPMSKRTYGTGHVHQKHGAWYGSWHTADGRHPNRKIGPIKTGRADGLTKTQAEARLREMMLEDVARAKPDVSAPTVSEMGAALLARLERDGKKRSHIETARGHLRKHIAPALGDERVTDITDTDVEALANRMIRGGLAPKTIRNVIGTLHSVMTLAVKGRHIASNPVSMVDLPKVRRSKQLRYLTQLEVNAVLATPLPDDNDQLIVGFPASRKKDRQTEFGGPQAVRDWWPVVRLLVAIAASTGMRLGELRALRWADIDYRADKIRVRREFVRGQYDHTKSLRSERGIPLFPALVAELDEHHQRTVWNQDADLVLAHPHTGRPLDHARLLLHFHAALHRAGVRQVRIHDLRHTFGTTVAASGKVSLRTLQEWMGHEDIRTTQIYADYMPSDQEAALLDDAFRSAGANWALSFDNAPQQASS